MPNGSLTYKRGEIWWVNLDPTVGRETGKKRPCLILQNDLGNRNGSTTIIAPFLPGHKRYPFVVNVWPTEQNALDKERHVNLSQLRTVDARRITNQLGTLEPQYWTDIKRAVDIEFGFDDRL